MFELEEDVFAISVANCKDMCLCQQDKMLMAIDLPDELVVTDGGGVEVRNAAEVFGGSLNAALRVPPPGDSRAVVDDAIEDGNAALQDFVREMDKFASVVGVAKCVSDFARVGEQVERRAGLQVFSRGGKREQRIGGLLAESEPKFAEGAHSVTPLRGSDYLCTPTRCLRAGLILSCHCAVGSSGDRTVECRQSISPAARKTPE